MPLTATELEPALMVPVEGPPSVPVPAPRERENVTLLATGRELPEPSWAVTVTPKLVEVSTPDGVETTSFVGAVRIVTALAGLPVAVQLVKPPVSAIVGVAGIVNVPGNVAVIVLPAASAPFAPAVKPSVHVSV